MGSLTVVLIICLGFVILALYKILTHDELWGMLYLAFSFISLLLGIIIIKVMQDLR